MQKADGLPSNENCTKINEAISDYSSDIEKVLVDAHKSISAANSNFIAIEMNNTIKGFNEGKSTEIMAKLGEIKTKLQQGVSKYHLDYKLNCQSVESNSVKSELEIIHGQLKGVVRQGITDMMVIRAKLSYTLPAFVTLASEFSVTGNLFSRSLARAFVAISNERDRFLDHCEKMEKQYLKSLDIFMEHIDKILDQCEAIFNISIKVKPLYEILKAEIQIAESEFCEKLEDIKQCAVPPDHRIQNLDSIFVEIKKNYARAEASVKTLGMKYLATVNTVSG